MGRARRCHSRSTCTPPTKPAGTGEARPDGAMAYQRPPPPAHRERRHLMTAGAGSPVRPWRIVGQGGAALTAGMGIGRFAYTPILPLMHAQAGLSPKLRPELATSNYLR